MLRYLTAGESHGQALTAIVEGFPSGVRVDTSVIDRELERYLPFLSTTKVLIAAVRKGVGRETAHEAIKEHAVAVALAMRETGQADNDLLERLAADSRLGLSLAELEALIAEPLAFTGAAGSQVRAVADRVAAVVDRYPDAASYSPGDIL